MRIKTLAALILSLTPFTGWASSYSLPMGNQARLRVDTSVTGSGNKISAVSAQIFYPQGGGTTVSNNPGVANFSSFPFATIPLTNYGTYTVTFNSTASGPGGSTNAPPVTHTITTYNPYQSQSVTFQYVAGTDAPSGWINNGAANTVAYRVYQYNVPASFSEGTNNRYVGQSVTMNVPSTVSTMVNARSGSVQVRITETGLGGTSTRTQSISNGQWTYTFANH
jgi:hypothetical protein